MKETFNKISKLLFLSVLIFSLFSCNNVLSEFSEKEYGNVSFSINGYDSSSRTIIPTTADKENLYFTLTGAMGESAESILNNTNGKPVDKMAYATFKESSFRLSSGIWHFTLTGYDSNNSETAKELIAGTAIDVIIAEGKNSVAFDMTPAADGKGSIKFVLNFNLGSDTESTITNIQAKLATIDETEEFLSEWPSSDPKPELSVSGLDTGNGMIVYNKKDVISGTYLLTFTVATQNSVNSQTCVGYRSDVVIVATGSESTAESSIELRQKYSISYLNEDGTEIDWIHVPTNKYYSSYEVTNLPSKDDFKRDEYSFIGWFTSAGTNKTQTDLNMTGPVTYYAHWQDKDLYVSPNGDDTNSGTQSLPFKTVAKALSVISSATTNLNWVIIIDGEIEEDVKITSTNASSITIKGLTGNTTDIIKGSTSTIMASAPTIPVVLKNITIKGGEGTEVNNVKSGGGVHVNATGASVVISEGAIITSGNFGNPLYGGGVYVSNGTVTLAGGSIRGNAAHKGGGVYIDSAGTFELASGSICENTVSYITSGGNNAGEGGGVYNFAGRFTMTGGSVTKNRAGSFVSSKRAGDGGGIYNAPTGTVNIEGGTIGETITTVTSTDCANYSNRNGGGIYNEGVLTLNNCTVTGNYGFLGSGVYTTVVLSDAAQQLISGNYADTDEYYFKDN